MGRNKSNQGRKKKSRSKSRNNKNRSQRNAAAVKAPVTEVVPADSNEIIESTDSVETSDSIETQEFAEEGVLEKESVENAEPETIDETQEESAQEAEPVSEPEQEIEHEQVQEPESETEPEHTFAPAAAPAPVKVKKKHSGLKVFGIVAALMIYSALFIGAAFAIERTVVSPERFHNNTVINDVDVSGMNIDEANDALTEEWNKHELTVVDSAGKEIGTLKNFDFSYNIDDELESALRPGAERSIVNYVKNEKVSYRINMTPSDSTDEFDEQFNRLSIVKDAEGDKPSKNAYIDKSDTEFRIVKEVMGNSVDTELLKKALLEAVARDEKKFEYRRSSFHKAPKIVSNSPELLQEREYCRKYLSFKIRLRNSINDYTITPDWLDKMLKVKQSGKTVVRKEKVEEFINETLYPKFSSTGDTRHLTSAGGGKYTISGGTYGFTIDSEKETSKLTKELKAREDIEREPIYSGKSPNKNGRDDIGGDFIEVDIAKQRVWVVINGKVKVDTPVVTGNVPRHNTPTGVYYIVYKATNTTLKGHNDDGSEYESHVAYWMPFYLGYGLHDASWRGVFGGSIYLGNGSHGCVNCPPAIMPKIFKLSYTGMPVIVH